MKTAEQIAKILYTDDLSRDVPIERDGGRAYDAWERAAGQAGDEQTSADLAAVDRAAFAAALDALIRAIEIQHVEKALEVSRRAARLYRFRWSEYLRTLNHELATRFGDNAPERFR